MPRRTLVPLLGALVLLVGGCSGGSEPEPQVESTPSVVSTSPAVESTAPVVETPEAFVGRWLDASVAMQNSGSSEDYRAITTGCAPCTALADRIDQYYAAGGYVKFGGQTVTKTKQVPSKAGTVALRATVDAEPTEYKANAGDSVHKIAGGTDLLEIVLAETDGGWGIKDFVRVAR